MSAQGKILLAEILISPRELFAEFMVSCEPLRCAACSNDLRWRMVWQREVLQLSCGEHSTISVAILFNIARALIIRLAEM